MVHQKICKNGTCYYELSDVRCPNLAVLSSIKFVWSHCVLLAGLLVLQN